MKLLVALGIAASLATPAAAQTEVLSLVGDAPGDGFGGVAFIGDVDGDGAKDFAVSSSAFDGSNGADSGRVKLFSGRTQTLLWTVDGAAAGQRFGAGLAAAGDVDLDGVGDVLVGSPKCGIFCTGGFVQVLSGVSGAALMTIPAPPTDRSFGSAVAGGHDLTGDGRPDFIVGAPAFASGGHGTIRVYDGASGTLHRTHDPSYGFYNLFGWAVEFVGDVNGDALAEYAFSSTYEKGLVELHDGASGARLWYRFGSIDPWAADQLGFSLASIGDQNGDGQRDLIAGAPQDATTETWAWGYVLVLDGVTGAQLAQIGPAPQQFSYLGASVAAVADLDGDGREEIAASLRHAPSVRIWSSASPSTPLVAFTPATTYGGALTFGDTNGDQLADLCVSIAGSTQQSLSRVLAFSIVRRAVVYCASETNSLGCTPAIASSGSASATSGAPFLVSASNVLNQRTGLCFYGFAPKQSAFTGGSLCVAGQFRRTPQQNAGGSAQPTNDCSGVFSLDFNARIQSGVDPLLVAGEEVFAQYWSRDPADASTTNLTDALAFFIAP